MNARKEKPGSNELPPDAEQQLGRVLLYQPDVLLNANCEDSSTLLVTKSLASMFMTGVNRVALLDEKFEKKNFAENDEIGYGDVDLVLEIVTKGTPRVGLHHKNSRRFLKKNNLPRFVLDTTNGLVRPQMEGIRDLPKYNWPDDALEVLKEMEDMLANKPEKKWFPHFAEHLNWMSRNVVSFKLAEFRKLVPYDQDIPNEYSSFVVVDTSTPDGDVHPLQQSQLIGRSVNIKAMDTGYVHVNCLSGCGIEIPSVALKGNGHEGIIVAGSHCDSCGNEYNPKFPNTTLKQLLSKVKK